MATEAEKPPQARAAEARDTALEGFADLDGLDDPVKSAQQEQEIAERFVGELSTAVVDGYPRSQANQLCGVASEVSNHYTKTALKDLLETRISEKKVEESGRRSFGEILRNDLNEVVVVRTTDAKQATKYRWQFKTGSVETTANSEGRQHFHWNRFRDEYFDATGEDAAKPEQDLRGGEEWREFIVELIENRKREVTTRGPRSAAVDDLQSFVQRSRAYNEIEYMIERDGLYLDADPRDEQPQELWMQNHDIKRICEENELSSVRELQIELDARDHTVDRVNGVSESTTVGGNKVTYWVIDADFAEVAEFVPDPVDPAEAVSQEEDDEDDDDDNEPGAIGRLGGGDE